MEIMDDRWVSLLVSTKAISRRPPLPIRKKRRNGDGFHNFFALKKVSPAVPHHSSRKNKSIVFSPAPPRHHACPLADSLQRCWHLGLVHTRPSTTCSRWCPSTRCRTSHAASLVYRSWHCVESTKRTSALFRLLDHHCVVLWDAVGLSFVNHPCCLTHPPSRPPPCCLGEAPAPSSLSRVALKGSSSWSGEVREYGGKGASKLKLLWLGLSFVNHPCCLTHPPSRPPPCCLGEAPAPSSPERA
jgi:hypothetical protein